jgi:1,2-diacylglycerol 3-beta-galactosyltransferase
VVLVLFVGEGSAVMREIAES